MTGWRSSRRSAWTTTTTTATPTYLKTRTYMCDIWRKSVYDDEVFAEADKIGLKVRDMCKEIEGDPNVGQNEAWKPIPY